MESDYDNAERIERILRKNGGHIIKVENKTTFKYVNKIKVFLPKELLEKNKSKDFKHLELFLYCIEDPLSNVCFQMISGRSILITPTNEPGYTYKPINFTINDLSDEEFDEFLKIFNIQGSCTSKISL